MISEEFHDGQLNFFLKMPMMFLLQFINISHLVTISEHLWIPCLVDTFPFPYLSQYLFEIVHTCVHIHNAHEVLSRQPQIFYICKPHFLLHIYDPLSIPCLAVIFVFF